MDFKYIKKDMYPGPLPEKARGQMTITAQAQEKLTGILKENPGKYLRIVFDGFG